MSVLVLMANFFSMYFARMNSLRSSLEKPKEKGNNKNKNKKKTSWICSSVFLHGAVEVWLANVQSGFHNLVETVVGHVPGNEQLRRRHVIQLSVVKEKRREEKRKRCVSE